jgi:hypothetical protein
VEDGVAEDVEVVMTLEVEVELVVVYVVVTVRLEGQEIVLLDDAEAAE